MMIDKSVGMKKMSIELKMLLAIMNVHQNPDQPALLMKAHQIDWNGVLRLAHHHRVYPIIYRNLKSCNNIHIPSDVWLHLVQDYQTNTYNMLNLAREMELLCGLFSDHDVRLIVLKGPVLTKRLFGDISLRTSKDLDIMVHPNDMVLAKELILKLGYRCDPTNSFVHSSRKNHISFIHPEKKVQIELHWRLNPDTGDEPEFDELWERRSNSWGNKVFSLGTEDLIFFLIVHGARHGWFRLRWLHDLVILLTSDSDVEKVLMIHNQELVHKLMCQVATLLDILFQKRISSIYGSGTKTHQRLVQLALDYIAQDSVPVTNMRTIQYQMLLKTRAQKLRYLISHLYPSTKDMELLRLPQHLRFLYFVLRPILLITRRVKKNSAPS